MRSFNKLFSIIGAFIFLAGSAFADSDGLAFDWEPFVVNEYLQLRYPSEKNLPRKLFIPKEILGKTVDVDELRSNDLKAIKNSSAEKIKEPILGKIKITFSSVNSFMLPIDEIYLKDKEGKISRAAGILPSLMRNPSQDAAVETLKLIEPQINIGIEF